MPASRIAFLCLLLSVFSAIGYHAFGQGQPGGPVASYMTQQQVQTWMAGVAPGTTVTTDSSGNWTVTFPAMSSSSPVIEIAPMVTGTSVRPNCKVLTRSATVQTGYCWVDNPIATALGITLLGVPVAWQSGTVMVQAKEPTQ